MMEKRFFTRLVGMVIIVLTISSVFISPVKADAAQVTSLSDTLSRLKASTNANHTMYFVSPTGIAAGQTVTLTFTGFVTSTVNAILFSDVDFATGNSGTCSSATYTEQTLAASASGATWGVAASSGVITITSGTGTATAGNCIRIKIGTNATNQTTGVNQIQNNTAGSATIAIAGTFTDSGTLAIPIISNDQVTVSATVDPTITFSISQTSVSFGTLSTSTGRWATNGGGANAAAATDPTASNTAHNLTVSTNAQGGYVISYSGATLTSGSNTIAVASISSDSDGSPGTSQFALCGKATTGSQTVTSGYVCSTNSSYNFVASTTTTLVTNASPANGDVTAVAYLANISGTQQAGAYTTTMTYIATATF